MIPKGNQRSGGQKLATHLLNAIDNDRVEVLEVRGAIANDLHGAFAEWRAASTGTNCKKYLYSLSINPDPAQRPLNRKEFQDFIARTEQALGLAEQPRAIVFHVKHGRDHCHVVWSRIDTEKMRAVQLSHDRQKLRTVARDFARDLGLELPHGMKKNRGQDRYEDRKKQSGHAERQQEDRTGITKEQRQRDITEAWSQSKTGKAFIKALEQQGYGLAQGTKRAYVVIDRYGEIHALARQIPGTKSRVVKDRLKDVPLESLPTAQEAQKQAQQKIQSTTREHSMVQNDPRRQKLEQVHEKKRAALEKKKTVLQERHNQQRQRLIDRIREKNEKKANPKGFRAFWAKMTGQQQQENTGITPAQKKTLEAQQRRHTRQIRNITRQERILKALEKRETRSLETQIRREVRTRLRQMTGKQLTPQQRIDFQKLFEKEARKPQTKELTQKPTIIKEQVKPPEKEPALPFQKSAAEPEKKVSSDFLKALKDRALQKKARQDKDRDRDGRSPS